MVKIIVLYILCILLFSMFDMTAILNLINSVLSYISNSAIGTAINSVFSKIGQLIDLVILNSETTVTTSTGVVLGNLLWLGMIVRIAVVFLFVKLILRLVI